MQTHTELIVALSACAKHSIASASSSISGGIEGMYQSLTKPRPITQFINANFGSGHRNTIRCLGWLSTLISIYAKQQHYRIYIFIPNVQWNGAMLSNVPMLVIVSTISAPRWWYRTNTVARLVANNSCVCPPITMRNMAPSECHDTRAQRGFWSLLQNFTRHSEPSKGFPGVILGQYAHEYHDTRRLAVQ